MIFTSSTVAYANFCTASQSLMVIENSYLCTDKINNEKICVNIGESGTDKIDIFSLSNHLFSEFMTDFDGDSKCYASSDSCKVGNISVKKEEMNAFYRYNLLGVHKFTKELYIDFSSGEGSYERYYDDLQSGVATSLVVDLINCKKL